MIRDFFFVVKMMGLTVLVVIFAQVKIGQKPLEDYFHDWVKTSFLVDYIQEAIDGGVALTKVGYHKSDVAVHGWLAKIHSHHHQSGRSISALFNFKRNNENTDDDGDHADPLEGKSTSPKMKATAE